MNNENLSCKNRDGKRSNKGDKVKLAYIAGPYTSFTAYEVEQNIRKAEYVLTQCSRWGVAAICPHTMTRGLHDLPGVTYEFWQDATMEMLERCDFLILSVPLFSAIRSRGTRGELRHCVENKKPVYLSAEDAANDDYQVPARVISEYLNKEEYHEN